MSPEALAAHARLAALPHTIHRKPEVVVDRAAAAEKAARTRRTRGRAIAISAPTPANIQPMKRRMRTTQPAPSTEPKPRKKRTSFVILAPKPNRWGFKRGELLEATGGKLRGQRGVFQGVSSSTRVTVVVDGAKRHVLAEHWRRVAG